MSVLDSNVDPEIASSFFFFFGFCFVFCFFHLGHGVVVFFVCCLSHFGFVSMNALLILSATKTALINFIPILALLLFFPDPVPFSSDPLMFGGAAFCLIFTNLR